VQPVTGDELEERRYGARNFWHFFLKITSPSSLL